MIVQATNNDKPNLGGLHAASQVHDNIADAGLWACWIAHRHRNGIIDDAQAITELRQFAERFGGQQ